ncbi:MAG: CHASE domain-containing protein [Candidatus Aminicenantes bacterium]|nr:CHASE domain-containing protein [Candidatus Aminicenantes bacterium]
MKESSNVKFKLPKYKKFIPCVALAVMLFLTIYVWRFWSNSEADRERRQYIRYTDSIILRITERLHNYMMILQGGAGLFAASEEVTRDEWRAYFKYRQVETFFPGIQGVGFSKVVRPSELARHIQGIRAEGYPDYSLWPEGERDVYTAIIFLEPFDARNRRAFGYDMFSEPVRRAAMERARDSGAVSISGKMTLVQETEKDVQTGFLMYVPVYAKGMPQNSVAERRAALEGYVYSPFRMNDLIRGIFSSLEHIIDHKIFDGAEVSPAGLMYDCDVHRRLADDKHKLMFSSRKTLDLYGHHWTLTFETNSTFAAVVDQWKSWIVLAAGLVISLLVFLLAQMLKKTGERAFSLAQKMTLALRQSEERLRMMIDYVRDYAIIRLDVGGHVSSWNKGAEHIKGYRADEIIGQHFSLFYPKEDIENGKPERHLAAATSKGYHEDEGWRIRKDGSRFWANVTLQALSDDAGQLRGFTKVTRDISERKRAEEKIKASLKEKEVLLQEIHHRVKNNLQVVSSLLNIQAKSAKDKGTMEILSESRNRINAMALIHAQLYESTSLSEVNMKGFVDQLLMQMFQSYALQDKKITPIAHVADYPLPISMAVPVGLILNELLTNAFKYAFAERKKGEIKVSLDISEKGKISLTVSDDGVGLPRGFAMSKSETVGLKLVKILVEKQLRGKIGIISKKGTTFKIEFDIGNNKEGVS